MTRAHLIALASSAMTASLVALVACGDDANGSGNGRDLVPACNVDAGALSRTCPEGAGRLSAEVRKPDSESRLPPPQPDAGGACTLDTECTAGANGHCYLGREPEFGNPTNACTYRVCSVDADCPGAMAACGCSVCYSDSNCRTNADCPSGERCLQSVPAFPPGVVSVRNGLHGFFCTTPRDDCNTPGSSGPPGCVWDPKLDRWAKRSDT